MTDTNMTELLRFMETAGGKSDRWLFIAMVIVVIAAASFALGVLWKFVQKLQADNRASTEKLMLEHKESRDAHNTALDKITKDQNETMKTIAVVLDRNTCALEGNGEILTECKDELRRCREKRG